MSVTVARGAWENGEFSFPIRVYYEDTDLGGMVYHGRYISFFERVRSESIRGTPCDVDVLLGNGLEGNGLFYVVRHIGVTYHRQAKAGDLLMGYSRITRVRSAAIEVAQRLERDGELVAEAESLVAIVDQNGRPRRWPIPARQTWQAWLDEWNAAMRQREAV